MPAILHAVDTLRILPLDVHAVARERFRLPAFAGSTLRGAFGNALADVVCIQDVLRCSACPVEDACAYPYLFETSARGATGVLRGVSHAPHPYALDPTFDDAPVPAAAGRAFLEGSTLRFRIVLLGRAVESVAVVAAAIARMGERGLASSRGRFALESITSGGVALVCGDPPRLFAERARDAIRRPSDFAPDSELLARPDARLDVHCDTPLRLIAGGALQRAPRFEDLIRALARRASSLLAVHEGIVSDEAARAADRSLQDAARRVRVVASRVGVTRRARFSRRQRRAMRFEGLTGALTYAFDESATSAAMIDAGGFAAFAPLLGLGAVAGAGKGTAFGFGRLRVSVRAGVAVDAHGGAAP